MTQTSPIKAYRNDIRNALLISILSIGAIGMVEMPILKAKLPIYANDSLRSSFNESKNKPLDGVTITNFVFDEKTCQSPQLTQQEMLSIASLETQKVYDSTGLAFGEIQLVKLGENLVPGFRVIHPSCGNPNATEESKG